MRELAVIEGADTKYEIGMLAPVSPLKSHPYSVHWIRPINTTRRSDRVLKLQPKRSIRFAWGDPKSSRSVWRLV